MKSFGEKLPNTQYSHRIGSYAVIIENERIAVIKSPRLNAYFLVGGGIENGESEKEALQREALEEIGYKISIHEKIGVATEYLYAEIDKKYIAKECHFYLAELAEKINEQTENELIWIGIDEIGELYHECHQWIVRQELKT
ncbi:MAG TPA: NUDIX domain-containing protein [Pyrinomonadaceae bacterium]|nr:NUDIX domain-containing protein [Pyrinomonadaceae bacterium]